MDRLMAWLPQHIPAMARDESLVSIVHGDYRLDNLMFHPTEPRVLAVLDWELSTLGHPLADFSYHCMAWHIPPGAFRGIGGLDVRALGIPTEAEYIARYCERTGFASPEQLQGRLELLPGLQPVPPRRHPARHRQAGGVRHRIERPGRRLRPRRAPSGRDGLAVRPAGLTLFSTHPSETTHQGTPWTSLHPQGQGPARTPAGVHGRAHLPQRGTLLRRDRRQHAPPATPGPTEPDRRVQTQGPGAGLWNLFLPRSVRAPRSAGPTSNTRRWRDHGPGAMGQPRSSTARRPTPATWKTLERYGSRSPQGRWLKPLLRGEIRSAFRDDRACRRLVRRHQHPVRIERDGDDYVINGRKWWSSGAGDPRCKVYIVMGKTDPEAPRHSQQHDRRAADTPGIRWCARSPCSATTTRRTATWK
jgi:hypothetical protein